MKMNDNVKFQEKIYNSREYGDGIKIDTRVRAVLKMRLFGREV